MNLPKQSRPVMRDVSREPLKAQLQGSQICPCTLLPEPIRSICCAIAHCC